MIRQCLILVAGVFTIWAGSASAQEARFPGLRVEVVGGLDITGGKLTYEDTAAPANDFTLKESTNGAIFGFGVGYDYPIADGAYIGVEGGYEWSSNEKCAPVFGGDSACFSLKRNYFAGIRGGTRLSRGTLAYAGVAYVNGKASTSYTDPAAPANNFAYSDERGGYRLSLGLEQRLAQTFYGKIEYRYSNYDDYTYASGTESASLGFDRNQIVAGVGVRF